MTREPGTLCTTAVMVAALAIAGTGLSTCPSAQTARWVSTTDQNRWVEQPGTQVVPWVNQAGALEVFPDSLLQPVYGFGACFNEKGWEALSVLSAAGRDSVIRALFDTTGCNFSYCRSPIGASDYAMDYYSLNDSPNDFAMANFTLARDKLRLIPFVKAALQYQPGLTLYGCPWSPPAWMKTTGNYAGGQLTSTDQNLRAYALYLSKFVSGYRGEGVPIKGIIVQNEAELEGGYPTCQMTPAAMLSFINTYLGPRFQQDGLNADIFIGTISVSSYNEYPKTILSDATANGYVDGVGVQWMAKDVAKQVHTNFPQKTIMETETKCCPFANDWPFGNEQFQELAEWLHCWVNAHNQWNMVLDQTGESAWFWAQSSMITVNSTTKRVTYSPHFYAAKHFSHFIKPGAVKIGESGSTGANGAYARGYWAACKNPNGDVVVVLSNTQTSSYPLTVKAGNVMVQATLPANSWNTLVIPGFSAARPWTSAGRSGAGRISVASVDPSRLVVRHAVPDGALVVVEVMSPQGKIIASETRRAQGAQTVVRLTTPLPQLAIVRARSCGWEYASVVHAR